MKMNLNMINRFCLFFVALFLMTSCGSEKPFQRGKKEVTPNPQVLDKPQGDKEPVAEGLDRSFFEKEILPMLKASDVTDEVSGCTGCHGERISNFEQASAMVVFKNPIQSELYLRAIGDKSMKHPKVWLPDTAEALKLIQWINGAKE